MADLLNVIVPVQQYEDMSLEDIHSSLINQELFNYFPGHFSYFNYFERNDGSFFGADNPEEMSEIARSWNERTVNRFRNAFGKVIKEAEEKGLHGDGIVNHMVDTIQAGGGYDLCWSIMELEGLFLYGMEYLVKDPEDDGFHVGLRPELQQDIMRYPEKYVLICCYAH